MVDGRDTPMVITYILKCQNEECYVGKTNNLKRRLTQHMNETYPQWFMNDGRRKFSVELVIKGDYEMEIKRFGVRKFLQCIKNYEVSRPW